MEEKSEILETVKAATVQINAKSFNCEIAELEMCGKGLAKLVIRGEPDDLKALYDYIELNE